MLFTSRERSRSRAIIEAAASICDLQPGDLMRRDNRTHVVRARHLAMWSMRQHLHEYGKPYPYPRIARIFRQHHSTVLYGIDKIENLRGIRPDVQAALDLIGEAGRAL